MKILIDDINNIQNNAQEIKSSLEEGINLEVQLLSKTDIKDKVIVIGSGHSLDRKFLSIGMSSTLVKAIDEIYVIDTMKYPEEPYTIKGKHYPDGQSYHRFRKK